MMEKERPLPVQVVGKKKERREVGPSNQEKVRIAHGKGKQKGKSQARWLNPNENQATPKPRIWMLVQFLTLVQVATVHHISPLVDILIAPKLILQAPKKLLYLEMAPHLDRWAINMKGKIITLGDSTINKIR